LSIWMCYYTCNNNKRGPEVWTLNKKLSIPSHLVVLN
jgi:hypothetical protein